MKKILNALFLTLLAVLTFSSCSDVPSPYDIKGEGDIPGLTGDGTKENPYNIASAQQKQDGSIAWVQGYIVGAIENIYDENNQFAGNKANFTGPFTIATNVLIAESPDETNESKCLPVKVKGGSDLSNALNLKDHPENKGEILLIQGELNAGFGKAALINTVAAVFNNKEIGEEQGGGGETGNTTITENQAYEVSFASDLAGFTVENKVKEGLTGDVWYYSKKYTAATASSYNGTGNVPAEGLFISPVLDMTAISKATLTFEHSSYSQGNSDELMLKAREANATEWTDLTISNYSTSRDNRVTTTVDLTSFAQKKVQIAFHYKNEASGSNNTWYIYNLKLAAGEGGGETPIPPIIEGTEIFTETFGTVTENTNVEGYNGWTNSNLAFSVNNPAVNIRSSLYKTETNKTESSVKISNIWFPTKGDNVFTISNINAAGYKKFVLYYEEAANTYNAGSSIDLNVLKIKFNGTEVVANSKVVTASVEKEDANIFYEMQVELNVQGTENSTLEFSALEAENTLGLRLANVRLYAVAEGEGEQPEEGVELPFTEGFGEMTDYDNENKTAIANWTHFDTKLKIVDTKGKADIRVPSKASTDACIWLPASYSGTDNSTEIEITGFNTVGYADLTLSYDLQCAKKEISYNIIKVLCDGKAVTVPEGTFAKANTYYPISISNIPVGTKKITFVSDESNTMGFRLDNIKLDGVK